MRDHGGNIDEARARHGGSPGDWIDLSTGINRVPYPLPPLPRSAWTDLPTLAAKAALVAAAREAWGTTAGILPVAGAQAAIQMIPRLAPPGVARVLAPTYNEHAAALRAAGWSVEEVGEVSRLSGADLAVVVNPNNPDGRTHEPGALRALAGDVGCLVVDESFVDPCPGLSLAAGPLPANGLVLRSFGKFFGLAGLRLGFVLASPDRLSALDAMAGPWPVSGAAIEIGRLALADRVWAEATTRRLLEEAGRLDRLALAAGWRFEGGSPLFRLYHTPNAAQAQQALARLRIWSRIFPWSQHLLRLGLPGGEAEWLRVEQALRSIRA